MGWARALASAFVVALSGCSYPSFAFVADGAGDANVVEADTARDDGGVDGGSDAEGDASDSSIADSGVSDTSSPDTALDAPDAGPVGCTGIHVFCDDFDTSTTPESHWAESYVVGGGTITLDSLAHSAPASLYATIPAETGTEVGATIDNTFAAASAGTAMRVDLWIRMEGAYSGSGVLFFKLQQGTNGHGVDLSATSSGLVVDVLGNGTSKTFAILSTIPSGWVHVRLEAKLASDSSGWFKAYVGSDVTKPIASASGLSTSDTTSANVKLVLGLYTNDTGPSYRARFDDVAFDWL